MRGFEGRVHKQIGHLYEQVASRRQDLSSNPSQHRDRIGNVFEDVRQRDQVDFPDSVTFSGELIKALEKFDTEGSGIRSIGSAGFNAKKLTAEFASSRLQKLTRSTTNVQMSIN